MVKQKAEIDEEYFVAISLDRATAGP
jgi:succinyl-CoA synthetase beta subunit